MRMPSLAGAVLAVALAGLAVAQTQPAPPQPMPMQQHQMPMQQQQMPMQHGSTAATDTPATRAYKAADARMHKAMAVKYTNDADKDFVAQMIPHHQGAIDMAKVVLQYGKDPEIRRLAEDIVAAQDKEIAQLRAIQSRLK